MSEMFEVAGELEVVYSRVASKVSTRVTDLWWWDSQVGRAIKDWWVDRDTPSLLARLEYLVARLDAEAPTEEDPNT